MNNLNFSKNSFGGQATPNNLNVNSYTNDGGRRSLDEVRQSQLEANQKIHPNDGKEFQVPISDPRFDTSKMTGAFIKGNPNNVCNESTPKIDIQMDSRRQKIDALNNLNRRNF